MQANNLSQQVADKIAKQLLLRPAVAKQEALALLNLLDWQSAVEKRLAGVPLPFLLGECEFHAISLCISDKVLVPRADSECMVDYLLDKIQTISRTQPVNIVEVGTGSGALMLALLAGLDDEIRLRHRFIAIDICPHALQVAHKNAQALGLTSTLSIEQGDLLGQLKTEDKFMFIFANLPYLSEHEYAQMPDISGLTYEPKQALVSYPHALSLIFKLLEQAADKIAPSGLLCLEHAPWQAQDIASHALNFGLRSVDLIYDLNRLARVSVFAKAV